MRIGKICLYTEGLDADERVATGVDIVEDLDAAISDAVAASGDPAIAVIPEGPYVVPGVPHMKGGSRYSETVAAVQSSRRLGSRHVHLAAQLRSVPFHCTQTVAPLLKLRGPQLPVPPTVYPFRL